MYQQINLYQPVFRRQHKIFSAVTLLQILTAVTVLLLGVYGYAQRNLWNLQHTSASLEQQYEQLEEKLGTLEDAIQDSDTGAADTAIDQLVQAVAERQELLMRFEQLNIKARPGFGGFFETLARKTIADLWLTGVLVTDDGEVELRGITLNPKLVPYYMQQLPDQSQFQSLKLGSAHLSRSGSERQEIVFVLRNADTGEQ